MEDNLQTIVIVVISVFLLFIFPVYMAYEKKDDISYALAMRYTQDLVDEVRGKGYLTKNMYEDYRAKLLVTGNTYDVNMTHEYNRYDPITNYYTVDGSGKYTLLKTTTQEEKQNIIEQAILAEILTQNSTEQERNEYVVEKYAAELGIDAENIRIEDTYKVSKQVYTTKYIESILYTERKLLLNSDEETVICKDTDEGATDSCQYAYIMNVDDNFNVTIKNTNTTLATVIYNMVTANTLDESTRIYVNYGGTILSNKWYGNVDYAKMDHEQIRINELSLMEEYLDEVSHTEENGKKQKFTKEYDGEYAIEFDVKPTDVTALRQKGDNINSEHPISNYAGYNFVLGNYESNNKNKLSVSVGLNGISLITNTSSSRTASIDTPFTDFPTYSKSYETTCIGTEEYECNDINIYGEVIEEKTCEREIEAQREITEYKKLILDCNTNGTINVTLIGKTSSIGDVNGTIKVNDEQGLLVGLYEEIENPTPGKIEGVLGTATLVNSQKKYNIYISERSISVDANQELFNEMTILSYAKTIADYTNVRIEFKPKENVLNKYSFLLYLNGEIVGESIDLDVYSEEDVPKINIIGMTEIRKGNPRYFNGSIKNVKLYN